MITFTRLLLGLLVLGIVGMHGLVLQSGTGTPHHSFAAQASTASDVHTGVTEHDHATAEVEMTPTTLLPRATDAGEGDLDTTALALCAALLLSVAAAAAGVRRTTWTRALERVLPRHEVPTSPWLRDRTPVPRFTVMRC